jgi:hypothetical protein
MIVVHTRNRGRRDRDRWRASREGGLYASRWLPSLCEATSRAPIGHKEQSDSDQQESISLRRHRHRCTGKYISFAGRIVCGWVATPPPSLPSCPGRPLLCPAFARSHPAVPRYVKATHLALAPTDEGQRYLERPTATSFLREGPDAPQSNSPRSLLSSRSL